MSPVTSDRPRILFYCDRRGWAFHTTATQLVQHLQDRYDFDVLFAEDDPTFDASAYDVIYVFWWAERRHRAHVFDGRLVVKEISSHRWEHQDEFGLLDPCQAVERWMNDASWLVATSRRLADAFRPVGKPVFQYSLGVDPMLFHPVKGRQGELVVGWAGNPADPAKRFREILQPACAGMFDLRVADGKTVWETMPEFFRSIDIILVASVGEGTPLPLLEAMACGCFPVVTNVGVVPEIIEHGRNGLIVEPSVPAFREALEWCRAHVDIVRRAGAENAALIHNRRTWHKAALQFSEIIEQIMASKKIDQQTAANASALHENYYERHFERINPAGFSDTAYNNSTPYLRQDIEPLLPANLDAKILEIGTGHGHFLKFIAHKGYRRIFGIDVCEPMLLEVRKLLAPYFEWLEVADAKDYLPRHVEFFDCIVMLDVIEHFTLEDARKLLAAAAQAISPGGRLILRTPNMANILGGYSLYMDLTHFHGYTEWSLIHLLEQSSLPGAQLHVPVFSSPKHRWKAVINATIHRWLYRLNNRAEPKWFGKNIVVFVDKPAGQRSHSER
jgi:2-polyprenyl-3-methyl-5-hydroxy-6-metoxy-1,4-benzoquinol methylase